EKRERSRDTLGHTSAGVIVHVLSLRQLREKMRMISYISVGLTGMMIRQTMWADRPGMTCGRSAKANPLG
ncbi:hypothetical protein U1Q18_036645, partial [Sarracenia purpurea var. burkii]